MAKNRNNRKGGAGRAAPVAAAAASPTAERVLVEKIAAVHEQAVEAASDAGVDDSPVPGPTPEQVDPSECWRLADEARSLFALAQRRLEDAEKRSNSARRDAESLQVELGEKLGSARLQEAELSSRTEELHQREGSLAERERDVLERELNASAGFAAQNRDALRRLQQERDQAEEELADIRARAAQERATLREELAGVRAAADAELERLHAESASRLESEAATVRADLEAERQELQAEHAALRTERVRLERDRAEAACERELLAGERAALNERVSRLAAAEVEDARAAAAAVQVQLTRAREERDRLRALLDAREEADLQFGHRTPEEVLEELRQHRADCERLRTELAVRPGRGLEERYASLERESQEGERERLQLREENRRIQRDLTRHMIAVTELETLRDQRTLLEARCKLLEGESQRLSREIDSLTEKGKAPHVFPACHGMDEEPKLQAEPELDEGDLELRAFVADLGQRIATDPFRAKEDQDPLYYSPRTLRAFLGGLAMSRLHLLQGISGTGKTSLPQAFARAVGAGQRLVEVQAGWRDRDDLVGHYNAFEHRFNEREFLKALYEAHCPAYRDRIYVVVLDEMNLSHPEHYFADLLSSLEQSPAEQRLVLLSSPDPRTPRHFTRGAELPIPQNVWIVGTANHDETTREFADKTYDRAHVMELPPRHERFPAEPRPPRDPVSLSALRRAFDGAVASHRAEADRACALLRDDLAPVLGNSFGIGWGNRFERQMGSFLPVVVAAGGTPGEAVDHMIASKLLRKLRDRHASLPEDLRLLRESMERLGERLKCEAGLQDSLAVIDRELRAQRGLDDAAEALAA